MGKSTISMVISKLPEGIRLNLLGVTRLAHVVEISNTWWQKIWDIPSLTIPYSIYFRFSPSMFSWWFWIYVASAKKIKEEHSLPLYHRYSIDIIMIIDRYHHRYHRRYHHRYHHRYTHQPARWFMWSITFLSFKGGCCMYSWWTQPVDECVQVPDNRWKKIHMKIRGWKHSLRFDQKWMQPDLQFYTSGFLASFCIFLYIYTIYVYIYVIDMYICMYTRLSFECISQTRFHLVKTWHHRIFFDMNLLKQGF